MRILSEALIVMDPDSIEIVWAPNSLEAAISDFEHFYLWFTNGQPPLDEPVEFANNLTWAPDGSRLVMVVDNYDLDVHEFVIVDADGSLSNWAMAAFEAVI